MNTGNFDLPGDKQQQPAGASRNEDASQENVQISLPHNDRPEGPFEHSGETAGWTHAEEAEKTGEDE